MEISANADYRYSRIYHGFAVKFQLKSVEIILLAIIVSFHEKKHTSYLSNASYAEMCGVSEDRVRIHLNKLRKLELIELVSAKTKYRTKEWRLGWRGEETLEEIQDIISHNQKHRREDKEMGL